MSADAETVESACIDEEGGALLMSNDPENHTVRCRLIRGLFHPRGPEQYPESEVPALLGLDGQELDDCRLSSINPVMCETPRTLSQ